MQFPLFLFCYCKINPALHLLIAAKKSLHKNHFTIYYFPWFCGLGFLRAWLGVLFQGAPPGDTPLQLAGGCYLVWKTQEISLCVYGTSLLFHMAMLYSWLLDPHNMTISGWLDFFPRGQAPKYKCYSIVPLTKASHMAKPRFNVKGPTLGCEYWEVCRFSGDHQYSNLPCPCFAFVTDPVSPLTPCP